MALFGRKKPSVPQEMPIAVAEGKHARVTLFENRIRVNGRIERDIYISSVASVSIDPAGRFTDGSILFMTSSGPQDAFFSDVNQFSFNRKQQPAFEHLRDELNKLIARRTSVV
jgi:hypothetical protein